MDQISVVLCTDEYNLPGLFVTVQSIFKNCSTPSRLYFYVIVSEQSIKDLLEFHRTLLFENIQIQIQVLNQENQAKIANYKEFCESNAHCKNLMNFARFFISDIFPEINTYLYIDTDYLVIDDITQLWDSLDKNEEIYAVPSEYTNERAYSLTEQGKTLLDLSPRRPFNAGIYIINSHIWKQKNRTEECISLINSKYMQKMFRFGTQPLLNYLFQGVYVYLPTKWNRIAHDTVEELAGQRPIDYLNALSKNDLIKQNISAVHFAGMPKPWLFSNQMSGGCWPAPNAMYKEYLPYTSTLILNKKLLNIYTEQMSQCIRVLNEFFSINLVFIDTNEAYTEFENYLESQCKKTEDSYISHMYYVQVNKKILINTTGLPLNILEKIQENQPDQRDGFYIITHTDEGIYIKRKNILEKIDFIYKTPGEYTNTIRICLAHIFLSKQL